MVYACGSFPRRGLEDVRDGFSLTAIVCNLGRAVTLIGILGLIPDFGRFLIRRSNA